MALASYSDLKAAIRNWCEDRADVDPVVADFIALSEAHFNLELRCREMTALATLGPNPTDGKHYLPIDFEAVRRVVDPVNPERRLAYISPDKAVARYNTTTGNSSAYSIIGSELATYPKAAGNVSLLYYQKIPALSDVNTSNWLLVKYPNLYLEAGQMEAARYFKWSDELAIASARVAQMIDRLAEDDESAQYAAADRVNEGVNP